jgi:hypothetical protein
MSNRRHRPPGDRGPAEDKEKDDEPKVVVTPDCPAPDPARGIPKSFLNQMTDGDHSRLREAHGRLKDVLHIRDRRTTALALVDNAARRKIEWQDIAIASGVGVGTFILLPWFIAIPAAVASLFYRTVKEAKNIRKTGPAHEGRLPGFDNFWAYSAYRFIRSLDGYNVRVAVIQAVRNDHWRKQKPESERLMDAADAMTDLLHPTVPKLVAALGTLLQYQPKTKDILQPPSREEDDRFRLLDPMKLLEGVSGLEWLEFDGDYILASYLPQQLRDDLARIESEDASDLEAPWKKLEDDLPEDVRQEIDDMLDESHRKK